ncbi:MAG TPA: hypothetical protein VFE70_05710 [Candidatus Elarobacter sp.]|nr:hypothetical protein [Candidatus Elarobacter sp.]
MTMLDRYLYAVQEALPKDQPAGDIVAEIGDDLQSQIDERASSLGRPLTEDEQAALLRAYGHPRVVAARYGGAQYLIGPELLPYYWSTLRTVATIVIAVELLGGTISAVVSHNGTLFFSALATAWNSLIWIFGIVTIIFAVNERLPVRDGRSGGIVPFRWDPRRLPAPAARPPTPRGSSIAEFIANCIALLVLLDAAGTHHIPLDIIVANALRDAHATLTPAWHAARIGAIAGTALVAASALAVFVRPSLATLHELVRAIASAAVIAGIAFTLQAGPWIEPASGSLNTTALYALVAALVILVLQLAISLRTLLRKPANRTTNASRAITHV